MYCSFDRLGEVHVPLYWVWYIRRWVDWSLPRRERPLTTATRSLSANIRPLRTTRETPTHTHIGTLHTSHPFAFPGSSRPRFSLLDNNNGGPVTITSPPLTTPPTPTVIYDSSSRVLYPSFVRPSRPIALLAIYILCLDNWLEC